MSIKKQLQEPGRGKHITGHSMTAPDTRHMVILNIIKDHAGHTAGGCVRQFLTDEGYNEVMQTDGRGDVKIIRHLREALQRIAENNAFFHLHNDIGISFDQGMY